MKKIPGIGVLFASVLTGIYLTCFLGNPVHYSQCLTDNEQLLAITQIRTKSEELLDALIFDEETLFYDNKNKTFYYSLVEGNSEAYDPKVELRSSKTDIQIAFLGNRISADTIKNNQTIDFLVYTDELYCTYHLKCTTLPMMNITCHEAISPEEIADMPVPMSITVFDNQLGAANRLVLSDGLIRIRGGSTRGYLKKGYDVSLTQESTGNHLRKNDRSLLGMRQDDDWVLYAAYNDPEKIRNVFSCSLWKDSCARDNAWGIDTGVEYRYLELFMNGEYWGLYALGYTIDQKQMQINAKNGREALYKVITWADQDQINVAGGNGFEIRGMNGDINDWSHLLLEYYEHLSAYAHDNKNLYAGIDVDNAIDLYLFLNLIQGFDHTRVNLIKNLYVAVRQEEDGQLMALYAPWDMDISWGNQWDGGARLFTVPYGVSADVNCVMESGYLNQLIINKDAEIWQKIFDKYWRLRAAAWSEETINAILDEYEADLFHSGAYLREQERWPDGLYADASDALHSFRSYVSERLHECDAYYERLSELCDESIFVRRSAQYKNFLESNFIIELNNKALLNDSDYIDLFAYMGIDTAAITDEVRFVIANPSTGKYDYLHSLAQGEEVQKTNVGTISATTIRDGVFSVFLNGVQCYDTSLFSRPDIRMAVINGQTVQNFSFKRGYDTQFVPDMQTNLSLYVDALSVTGYQAIIEVNDLDIWQNPDSVKLFEKLGLSAESIHETTDFIIWNGSEKTVCVLDHFHTSGSRSDTPIGGLSLFVNEEGDYGIYRDNEEVIVNSMNDRLAMRVRILLLDPFSHELIENISF